MYVVGSCICKLLTPNEVKSGTLLGILKLAKVSREEFLERATK